MKYVIALLGWGFTLMVLYAVAFIGISSSPEPDNVFIGISVAAMINIVLVVYIFDGVKVS